MAIAFVNPNAITVLSEFISIFASVLTWAIIIRALLSWFSIGGVQPVFRLLVEITEPVLAPIRRVLPTAGMLDFSPLVALLLIQVIRSILLSQLPRL
ncbi:MAG TPA: YggT family protein [Chloroflexota bacterium]|nr:YggT family protein [Chloroflexota bacterium]